MTMNTDDFAPLRVTPFADAIKKFEGLITQGRRAFLLGAGASSCAGLPMMGGLTKEALASTKLMAPDRAILSALVANFVGANNPNIEDYLSELTDLLAIAERRTNRAASARLVEIGGAHYADAVLRETVRRIKTAIFDVLSREVDIETHEEFVRAVHREIRPGKWVSGQTVDYLILNYDTLIEDALGLVKMPYADGLEGGTTGWWSPNTFERPDIVARVFKLHGSINWREIPDEHLPRRIPENLSSRVPASDEVMIWPASTKYRETQRDPYAMLADRVRKALRPTTNTDLVLVVCGYSFGDSHINIELDRALRESSGQLAMVVFTSEESLSGELLKWNRDPATSDRMLVFSKRGFYHGSTHSTSPTDLPWWKFEHVTRLIRGDR
jgi:hypothetical protein